MGIKSKTTLLKSDNLVQLEIVFSMVLLHLMYKNTYSPIKYLLTLFTDENYNFGYLKQNPLLAIESLGKYIALKTIVCNSQLFDHYLTANISITVQTYLLQCTTEVTKRKQKSNI